MNIPEASNETYFYARKLLGDLQIEILRRSHQSAELGIALRKSNPELSRWNASECHAYLQAASDIAEVHTELCSRIVKKPVDTEPIC